MHANKILFHMHTINTHFHEIRFDISNNSLSGFLLFFSIVLLRVFSSVMQYILVYVTSYVVNVLL